MAAKVVQVHILISGRVQGIGFRWWIQRKAQGLQLTGWVKNIEDGRVEVVAEGSEGKLTELIGLIKKKGGPMSASVDTLETEWNEADSDFQGFEIRRSSLWKTATE